MPAQLSRCRKPTAPPNDFIDTTVHRFFHMYSEDFKTVCELLIVIANGGGVHIRMSVLICE